MCIRARLNYSKFAVFVTCSHGIKCDVSINLFRTKTGQGPGIIKISIASSHAFNFYFLSSRWPAGGFKFTASICHVVSWKINLIPDIIYVHPGAFKLFKICIEPYMAISIGSQSVYNG